MAVDAEKKKLTFASDNYAGICPEAWEAMARANSGYAASYGDDRWTEKACAMIRDLFETDCDVFFVFNGTAANSLALASLCHSYHSIICHNMAHVETDECGAAEFFSNGTKILLVGGDEGKVDTAEVEHTVSRRTDIHYPKSKVLSVTQSTELGTVYTVDELKKVKECAERLSLRVHMDGARFANAVASQNVRPRELSWEVGVDVLCLGGAKNGMGVGEAVIFFKKDLAWEFDYRCKQAGQLASKMRFLAAPWIGMLESGAWLRNATHANTCARMLAEGIAGIPGVYLRHSTDANAVFVDMPETMIAALRDKGWHFYTFIGSGCARFMCSWNTDPADVNELIADFQAVATL